MDEKPKLTFRRQKIILKTEDDMTELEKMILRATNNGKIQDYKHLRKELKSLERRSLIKCIWDEQQNLITAQITTFGKAKI